VRQPPARRSITWLLKLDQQGRVGQVGQVGQVGRVGRVGQVVGAAQSEGNQPYLPDPPYMPEEVKMKRKIVVACFGDAHSAATIQQLAATNEVIAVALDFGGAVSLVEMRDRALAAGAARCHALDVREEFARESLLPALHAREFTDPSEALLTLAPSFATRKLQAVAALEQAPVLTPDAVAVPSRPLSKAAVDPLYVDIRFEEGVPVAINDVEMPLVELLESIETITGEPAFAVLNRQLATEEHQVA
jgi:argininosuccinate synthase